MFHFPPFPSASYVFRYRYPLIKADRFPHSDIPGLKLAWQLPGAYRSLPRPSSVFGTKTSTIHP